MNSILAQFQDEHALWLPAPKDWRLVAKPVVGEINGLPTFRGMAVATNGILVAILTSANKVLLGHLQWFVKDEPEKETDLFEGSAQQGEKVNLNEFEELF